MTDTHTMTTTTTTTPTTPTAPSVTLTLTLSRGDLLVSDGNGRWSIYTVLSSGAIRGRELVWVETADGRPARVIPANTFRDYVDSAY